MEDAEGRVFIAPSLCNLTGPSHLKPSLCLYLAPALCVLVGTLLGFLCVLCSQGAARVSSKWERLGLDLCGSTLNFLNLLLESSRE